MPSALKQAIERLSWLPPWAAGALIFGAAALAALIVHAVVYGALERLTKDRGLFVRSLVSRTRRLARLGLVALALAAAANLAPLTPAAARIVSHTLQVLFIAFVGWAAFQAVHIGTVIYMRRFKQQSHDDLLERRHVTQVRILERIAGTLITLVTIAAALMTFPGVRQYGISLLASAGVAGVIIGFALQSLFANLMAGVQIALTQPIRLDDSVLVEGEFGQVEEITSTYVVLRLWDRRRMIVPLKYFLEKPFQNWTRQPTSLIGAVLLRTDYTVPVEELRAHLKTLLAATPLWDGEVANLQVTEAFATGIELRILASARNAKDTWDLRCFIREKVIEYLKAHHPEVFHH